MKYSHLVFPMFACAFILSPTFGHAEPGGCLKGAMAGGVAGHFVGSGHAKGGASAGCAAGMVRRHNARKAAAAQEEHTAQPSSPDADTGSSSSPHETTAPPR
ncbi:hypothetical protein [Novacetimonas hansenii]|uniref:Glycine zipper 2TM domain protein n=1 Tax=Novacetimonas hansenii TaxID=436 RepID=A0AAW5ESI9_NOVHA|nr:hypothetical protein [Novacetimonas hansenii]MCJ8354663.1 hypothetical protein [Novacetimonas hansenii]